MARLPALVDAIAAHDRRGRPAIAHIARQVRTAGLISSTKRGAGGAVMAFADAATLLLATCGDSSPHAAVEAVANLRRLRPTYSPNRDRNLAISDNSPNLQFFGRGWNFYEVVELMIEFAPDIADVVSRYTQLPDQDVFGRLPSSLFSNSVAWAKDLRMSTFPVPPAARLVRVVVHVPGMLAEVHIGREFPVNDRPAFHEYYVPEWVLRQRPLVEPPSGEAQSDGCLITIEVGLPTLLALHRAVTDVGIE
jgi:hypothetical protein